MDKRYYSEKHRRNNKKRHYTVSRTEQPERRGTFILRLNICLAAAIIAVGIYKLNNETSKRMTDSIISVLSSSTSADSIRNTALSVFSLISEGKHMGFIANIGDDVALDKESLDYIAENENMYYNRQKALESP